MTQIKLRRDTTANWATANSVLAQGEPAIDTTTNSMKIGDGTTHWTDLQYIVPPLPLTPNIAYTGTFGGLPELWRYTASTPRLQYSSNCSFRTTGDGLYWLDDNFDDGDYDLSGVTSIHFTNIGGVRGYLDFSSKSEVVMTTLDLGDIAVVDEWVHFAGFSNTLTTFAANNLVDIGGNFEIYGMQLVDGPTWHFPSLDRVTGSFYIDYNWNNPFSNTAAPTFPALTFAGNGMWMYYNKYTSWSDFTSLTNVQNNFQFRDNYNDDNTLYSGPGAPALVHVKYGNLEYFNNDYMQNISEFAALTRIDGSMNMYQNPELESFPSFPVLEYVAGVYAYNNYSMTTLDGTNSPGGWLPSVKYIDGNINFQNCALTETSVNLILMKLALLDGTSDTTPFSNRVVYLDQGTNAIPSGDGITAIATLEGRGCTVYVNS